jgi:adenylate kinase
MRWVFLGGPGAGKGTQAKRVEAAGGPPQLSTGDLLRSAVERGTDLGRKARSFMDAGALVPDDIMLGLIREVLSTDKYRGGFILDGFPRTVAQAEGLGELLEEMRLGLDGVLSIEVPDEVIVGRLSNRWMCEGCGELYNLKSRRPRRPDACDCCGGRLVQRDDDRPDTVRRRLEVYHRETEAVKAYYSGKGCLRTLDGNRSADDVFRDLEKILGRFS